MDFRNSLWKFTFLSIGYYNFHDKTVYQRRLRVLINRVFFILNLFCTFKLLCILISPDPKAIFYLVELHFVESNAQKAFHIGLVGMHTLTGYMYLYWTKMDAKSLECLKHLFIPNINDLCQYYHLDLEFAKEFLKKSSKKINFVMGFDMFSFEAFFTAILTRCFFISYLTLDVDQFLFIALPFFVITLVSYHCLTFVFLFVYKFVFTTMEFLVLRTRDVSVKISNLVESDKKATKLGLKKNNKKVREIKEIIIGFIIQHKKANAIFDHLITFIFVNVLISAFIYPAYIYFEPSYKMKFFIAAFYFCGIAGSVVVVTVFNDQFMTKVG